jgi:hypothetical protein
LCFLQLSGSTLEILSMQTVDCLLRELLCICIEIFYPYSLRWSGCTRAQHFHADRYTPLLSLMTFSRFSSYAVISSFSRTKASMSNIALAALAIYTPLQKVNIQRKPQCIKHPLQELESIHLDTSFAVLPCWRRPARRSANPGFANAVPPSAVHVNTQVHKKFE